MMKRFDLGPAAIAADTATIYKLYDNTDNPVYDDADGSAPTAGTGGPLMSLIGGLISVSQSEDSSSAIACVKAEVGLTNSAKSSFTPAITFTARAGVIDLSALFRTEQPRLDFSHATINLLAIRVTPSEAAEVAVAGYIDLKRENL